MFTHIKSALDLDIPSSEKLVLVALSRYADAEGACYPGIGRLAQDTSLTTRTVTSCVGALSRRGLIEKRTRSTSRGRTSNSYILRLGQQSEIDDTQTDTISHSRLPRENNELAILETKPVKRQRKPDYDAFKDYWNAVIPPHWAQCIKITDTRQRLIKKLYEDVGAADAFDVFAAGVGFCVNDGWWLGKDGISIENIMSNGKLVGFAEKQQAKDASGGVTGQQVARVTAPANDLAAVLADDYGHN